MRIISENGEFNLPVDFESTLNIYNSLISTTGNQTLPITLPDTDANRRLLDFTNRFDRYYKPITEIPVTLQYSVFSIPCNLVVNDIEELSVTLYMGIGSFYSLIDGKKLPFISWPVYKISDFTNKTLSQKVNYLLSLLNAEYENPTVDAIYKIAPVVTTEEVTRIVTRLGVSAEITRPLILNGFEHYQFSLDFSGSPQDTLIQMEGNFTQTFKVNGNSVPVTTGYAVTPFLKLSYVLETVFTSFGFTFDSTELGDIENCVLYNNIADAIYAGILDFSQLLPNVLISDFLSFVEKIFVGKFFVNNITKTVNFKLFSDCITSDPDMDITPYMAGKIIHGMPEFKIVRYINNADKTTKTDNAEYPYEDITFDLITSKNAEDEFSAPDANGDLINLRLHLAKAENGIIHKNSTLILNGEAVTEKTDSSADILLFEIFDSFTNADIITDPGVPNCVVKYKGSTHLFSEQSQLEFETDFRIFEDKDYALFRSSSNIPGKGKSKIPVSLLHSIDLSKPKLLDNQKVFIESILQNIPSGADQEIKIRTTKTYF